MKYYIRYWIFTNFTFGVLIFKSLHGSVPEILEFQYGSRGRVNVPVKLTKIYIETFLVCKILVSVQKVMLK